MNQDNSQLFSGGQLLGSCTLGMAPARRRRITPVCRNEGKIGPQGYTHNQTSSSEMSLQNHYTAPISASRPPPHNTQYERGRYRGDLQAQFHGVEVTVRSTHCGIVQPTSTF